MQPCVGVACPRSVAVGMFEKAQASQERTSCLLYKPNPGAGWALSGGSPVSARGSQPTGQRPSRAGHLRGLRGCLCAPSRGDPRFGPGAGGAGGGEWSGVGGVLGVLAPPT